MSSGEPLLVGVDVGTTRIKAGLIGLDGRELGRAEVPTIWQRRQTGADARPRDFFEAVSTVLAAVVAKAPPGQILGVGVTSMAETAVLVGPDGLAVGPAVAWHDRRAETDFAQMYTELTRAEIGHQTGLTLDPIPTVAMLRCLTRAHPTLRQAATVLSVAEWVVHSLGGSIAAEPSLASRTGALAITSGQWWPDVIQWASLPETMFPELRTAGTSWGRLRAKSNGLKRLEGAALTVAGHDHVVASIGSGVTAAHQVMNSCGTAEALVRAVPADAALDPARGLSQGIATGRHVLADHYCLLAGLPLGIDLIPLLQRLRAAHRHGRTSLDEAVLAFLDGELTSGELSPAAHQWLSALQGSTTRASAALRALEDLGGPIAELRVSGGWAANPVLQRLQTDAVPSMVYPRVTEAGARGAALLAGLAAGVFASTASFPAPAVSDQPAAAEGPVDRSRPLPLSNQLKGSLVQ